jgi:hypothetical protein
MTGKPEHTDSDVEEAGVESFPASDAPSFTAMQLGAPERIGRLLDTDPNARLVWNEALEQAARLAVPRVGLRMRDLADAIRSLKRRRG